MNTEARHQENPTTPQPDATQASQHFAEFETPAVDDDNWPQEHSSLVDAPAGEEFEPAEAGFDDHPGEAIFDCPDNLPHQDDTLKELFDTPAGSEEITHATGIHPGDDPQESSFATPTDEAPPKDSPDTAEATARREAKSRGITQELAVIHQNRAKLSQMEVWREIVAELPRRTKWSLVLVVVLATLVLAGYNILLSAPVQELRVSLPQKLRSALPHTATPKAIVASLESVAQIGPQVTPGPTPTPTGTPSAKSTPLFLFHTVEVSDTLIAIAAQYDVTAEALLVANNLRNPDDLQTGQYLLIPSSDEFTRQKVFVHEVKNGDTLLSIATKYGSSVIDIREANPGLDSDDALQEGQTVAVPIVFLEANPAIEPSNSDEAVYHIIKSGETPLQLAAQYDIPVEILLSVNNITDPTLLQIGQELIIPPHDGISLGFPVILYEWQATDTLIGVATRFGSSVKDILAVNPELDPTQIEAGQLVAVPVIFQPPRPTPAPDSPAAPRPTPGPPPPANISLEQQLVQAINTERVNHGLSPHTYDGQLAASALHHAQDMYVRDFFSHVNPDGATLSDRLNADGIGYASAGENIQRNTQPRNETVAAAMGWFMNSAPHRANILHPNHNRVGVAVVEGPPGWFTFVLVFAER